jgi:hypothetical protein
MSGNIVDLTREDEEEEWKDDGVVIVHKKRKLPQLCDAVLAQTQKKTKTQVKFSRGTKQHKKKNGRAEIQNDSVNSCTGDITGDDLPLFVVEMILGFCCPSVLLGTAKVCKKWNQAAHTIFQSCSELERCDLRFHWFQRLYEKTVQPVEAAMHGFVHTLRVIVGGSVTLLKKNLEAILHGAFLGGHESVLHYCTEIFGEEKMKIYAHALTTKVWPRRDFSLTPCIPSSALPRIPTAEKNAHAKKKFSIYSGECSLFCRAIQGGSLSIVQWLYNNFNRVERLKMASMVLEEIDSEPYLLWKTREDLPTLTRHACTFGSWNTMKWCMDEYFNSVDTFECINMAGFIFMSAVANEQQYIATQLYATCNHLWSFLGTQDGDSSYFKNIFMELLISQKYGMAQWFLVTLLQATREEAASWLQKQNFPSSVPRNTTITPDGGFTHPENLTKLLGCQSAKSLPCHENVATNPFVRDNLDGNKILYGACEIGELSFATWFQARYSLRNTGICVTDANFLFSQICEHKNFGAAEWLMNTFQLTLFPETLMTCCVNAAKSENFEFVQTLCDKHCSTVESKLCVVCRTGSQDEEYDVGNQQQSNASNPAHCPESHWIEQTALMCSLLKTIDLSTGNLKTQQFASWIHSNLSQYQNATNSNSNAPYQWDWKELSSIVEFAVKRRDSAMITWLLNPTLFAYCRRFFFMSLPGSPSIAVNLLEAVCKLCPLETLEMLWNHHLYGSCNSEKSIFSFMQLPNANKEISCSSITETVDQCKLATTYCNEKYHFIKAFSNACEMGNANIAEFLHKKFHFTREQLRSDRRDWAICKAFANGHLGLGCWLLDTFSVRNEIK